MTFEERLSILTGDCRDILPRLPAESVQTCCTSPPYWGLRDYGTAQWEGGEAECDHKIFNEAVYLKSESTSTLQSRSLTNSHGQHGWKSVCGHCGARRIDSQLGLESTPQEYIANMVAVFRAVWRVLRDDGTLWVNMGDSYASPIGGNNIGLRTIEFGAGNEKGKKVDELESTRRASSVRKKIAGLKPKDLCMMPARLAMALQADGWYLRSDIIWHKPNPMPESVTDRPTKAHEYIFLLTKIERYFYDAEAIREPQIEPDRGDNGIECRGFTGNSGGLVSGRNSTLRGMDQNGAKRVYNPNGRNKRSVWTIPTQPYSQAHSATFPEEIPKLCILAGSKPGDTVLDPFAGSGTVGKVALELGRKAILIELNPDYIALAESRTNVTPGFL